MKRNTQAGVCLVRMALTVDPLFAAELSRYCGAFVWRDVGAAVQERLRAIHATGEGSFRQYAVAAMLATGKGAFGDILVPLLSAPSQRVRLGAHRLWSEFDVSSLGGNWREVVRGWTEEAREDFVSEILHHRVDADVAAFAADDESSTVKKAAAAGLVWIVCTGRSDRGRRERMIGRALAITVHGGANLATQSLFLRMEDQVL